MQSTHGFASLSLPWCVWRSAEKPRKRVSPSPRTQLCPLLPIHLLPTLTDSDSFKHLHLPVFTPLHGPTDCCTQNEGSAAPIGTPRDACQPYFKLTAIERRRYRRNAVGRVRSDPRGAFLSVIYHELVRRNSLFADRQVSGGRWPGRTVSGILRRGWWVDENDQVLATAVCKPTLVPPSAFSTRSRICWVLRHGLLGTLSWAGGSFDISFWRSKSVLTTLVGILDAVDL